MHMCIYIYIYTHILDIATHIAPRRSAGLWQVVVRRRARRSPGGDYIERERERDLLFIYIYIYIYNHRIKFYV